MYGLEVTVVYTDVLIIERGEQEQERRIISARRATRHERETYYREVQSG